MNGILLDESFDLHVKNGTLAVGEITEQNQKLILLAQKGEFKESPLKGVGINPDFIETHGAQALVSEIREQYRREGLTVDKLRVTDSNVEVVAHY
jgi:hypothetical protein